MSGSPDLAPPPPPPNWTMGSGGAAGASTQHLTTTGTAWNFAVWVPASYNGATGVPLVLHFHGWRPLPAGISSEVKYVWSAAADANNFIAVAPEGQPCPELDPGGPPFACFKETRDWQFIQDLLAYLGQNYNINRDQVYLSGHSGGSFFVQGLGLMHPEPFAAAVEFEGGCISASDLYGNSCSVYDAAAKSASRKLPYYAIHYPQDMVVPSYYTTDLIATLNGDGYTTFLLGDYANHNGGSSGHSIDNTEVPAVWTWLSMFTRPAQ